MLNPENRARARYGWERAGINPTKKAAGEAA
jgi:hypothetical protein